MSSVKCQVLLPGRWFHWRHLCWCTLHQPLCGTEWTLLDLAIIACVWILNLINLIQFHRCSWTRGVSSCQRWSWLVNISHVLSAYIFSDVTARIAYTHFWEKTWVQCQRMARILEVTPEINYSTFVQSNPHQASSIHVCFDSAMWKTKPKHLGHCTTDGTALSAGLLSTCFGCARIGIKFSQGELKKEITLRQI